MSTVPKDEEGFTIVTIADIIEYLQQFPKETQVDLDKDGWMCSEIRHSTIQELIKQRGLFESDSYTQGGIKVPYFVINN